MKTLEEPPYLTVGTDVSAKYRGAFCEAKIKIAKRLVKAKVTFKPDCSTGEVHDEHIRGPLKVGATVEARNSDGAYQEAVINKLTDASLYTVVFDDGDEKTLRRSSLCLKGARHFAESETLDRLPLTNPEHFGTPVIGKKTNRGRRSNPVQEEESSSSSSEEDEGDQQDNDELLGKVVCVEAVAPGDRKKSAWYPALVISPDCSEDLATKKDTVLVRSFRDGKFCAVLRKDVREIDGQTAPKPDAALKPALDGALEFLRCGGVPSSWRTEVKDETSSSEDEEDEEEEEPEEDASSGEEEEEVEPFPEERENFLQQLYKFMEDRGTPINKRPVLGYRNLNLFKLYRLVHKLGGFDNIDSGSVWKQVYQDLGIPVLNSAAGYNVKCAYRKYLYGFEEYCTSSGIAFQMALPHRAEPKAEEALGAAAAAAGPPVAPGNGGASEQRAVREEQQRSRPDGKPADLQPVLCKQAEEEEEEEADTGSDRLEAARQKKEEEDEAVSRLGRSEEDEDADEEAGDEAPSPRAESVKPEPFEELRDGEKSGDDSSQEGEGEEFESYPAGMKVQVRYGRGRNQKTYEATVKESDLEGGEVLYLVHYCGWNVRYDEWVKADKIVRPANKNVPKVKHRKKIKNKTEREKDRLERLTDREDLPPSKNHRIHRSAKSGPPHDGFSPLDEHNDKGPKHAAAKSIEITSILNGLQASESSTDESEHEEEDDCEGDQEEDEQLGSHGDRRRAGLPEGPRVPEHWEGSRGLPGGCRGGPGGPGGERVPGPDGQEGTEPGKRRGPPEPQGEGASRKRKAEAPGQRPPKGASRSRPRSSRTADWLPHGSPQRPEERSAGPRGETSGSSSSEDEGEGPAEPGPEAGGRRGKAKGTPSKKYNGLKEKTKGGRSSAFWEVPEKRPKLALGGDERPAGGRGKGQKDVWSSIQAQWPKKTLKELFSDSDTEAANSPPPAVSPAEDPRAGDPARDGEAGRGSPEPHKTRGSPSSGSNSVLNTPPTTPESPAAQAGSPRRTLSPAPPPAPPPPSLDPAPEASPRVPGPPLEESMGGRSETDSSTVEVESLGGELPPEDRPGSPSMAFDGSLSCHSSCSSQHDGQQRARAAALANQKQQKDSQGGGASKKHKRSHKNSGTPPKKSRKMAHSSDSEDHSTSENTAKSPAPKTAAAAPKCPGRTPPAGHRYHKHGDAEHQGRTPRVYKWSFQMSDLEKMTSLERISFLQEKLQDIRNHYLSLKSEVASIDRRRKRMKKKERESTVAASSSSSSSSSSSPSSSSLTAAVMLTLAEPTVSGSSQNSGVSVECR
ncbi:AT-rich interactive domain-containing protein 4B isoform X1 [Anguilla rostrata]|uniref:AT-rich interactive domain-containing protein 4B isoform X1 n=1 Tax=Anguilla rostrata TaxID=7938 RepID=UPI0030CED92E